MALATTCPACKTSFKVNPEQLKLRKGLVRCGKCDHVFSGVDYLRYVREKRNEPETDKTPATEKSADTANDSAESDAISPDTETVAQDLNTAFFLPETQIDLDAASQPESSDPDTETDKSADPPTEKSNTRKQPRSKSARRNSRRRKRRRTADRDPNATSPEIAAIEDRRHSGRRRADGAAEAPEESEAPEKEITASIDQPPATGVESESEKQDLFDRQFGEAIAANQGVSDDPAPDDSDDSEDGAEDFPDTLQANLPEAWQTTAIWPTYEESMLEGQRPADLPTEVGERSYRGKSEKADADTDLTQDKESNGSADDVAQSDQHDLHQSNNPSNEADVFSDNDDEHTSSEATFAQPALQSQQDALSVDDTQAKPEEDAIDFFGQTSKPVFDFDLPPRSVWLAAAGLTALLALQGAIGARDTLAAMFPPAKPILQSLVSPLGLTVDLPLNAEAITIESFDLINTADSGYVMNMLMRNRAETPLRWPAIELTLTDSTGGILVRKALMPADYLKDEHIVASGINENSEHIVRLQFNAPGINPSGYSAVLFYH